MTFNKFAEKLTRTLPRPFEASAARHGCRFSRFSFGLDSQIKLAERAGGAFRRTFDKASADKADKLIPGVKPAFFSRGAIINFYARYIYRGNIRARDRRELKFRRKKCVTL